MHIQPIPLGYCQCGCGEKATIAPTTNRRLGVRAGQPNRFLLGHHVRVRPLCYADEPVGDVAYVPVFRGSKAVAFALVDASDWALATAHRWRLNRGGYARTVTPEHEELSLHRLVFGLRPHDGRQVDHINRNPLDNRRENLRESNPALQAQNRGTHGVSQYRGVCWAKDTGKWQASARVAGQMHYLGQYVDEAEAGRVASEFRALHMPHSEDARLAYGSC